MKGIFRKIMPCLMVLVCTACSAVNVSNKEADPEFSLIKYKTFDFYKEGDHIISPEIKEYIQVIQDEVIKNFQAKGLSQNSSQPDLLVNLGVMVTNKAQTRQTQFGQDSPYYIGQRRYSWKSQEVQVGTYQQGSISMHLVDPKTNQLVWRADAAAVIPKKREKLMQRVKEGVDAIFIGLQ